MTERAPDPTPEALEAAIAVIARRDAASGPIIQDIARALDSFAQATVERERQIIAGWLDCTDQCRYVNASGTCQRTDELCSHHVAESIRAGEQPWQ